MIRCPYCCREGFMQFDNGPLECTHCDGVWWSKGMHDDPPESGSTELHIWPGVPKMLGGHGFDRRPEADFDIATGRPLGPAD